jgi:alpha-beta hydrolase superfamily lysophospholipase
VPLPDDFSVVATTLTGELGTHIAAWYLPAENSRATIVLLHGIRGDRRSMVSRAAMFRDAGYATVMVDLPAHGESPGDAITFGYREQHGVRAAVEFARSTNPDHRIAVLGISLGGAAALLGSPLGVDAVVVESVYPTINRAVHNRVANRLGPLSDLVAPALLCQLRPRLGITTAELRPIDHIAAVGCPILVASGELDHHTTLADTQELFNTAREPKQLAIFDGAGHVDLFAHDPESYRAEILPFLDEQMHSPVKPATIEE